MPKPETMIQVCSPIDFMQAFRDAEDGTSFPLFAGRIPAPGDAAAVVVSTYNYANLADLQQPFEEQYTAHSQYRRGFARACIVLSAAEDSGYEFVEGVPFFRALPVTLLGNEPMPASIVGVGDGSSADDYWLVKA